MAPVPPGVARRLAWPGVDLAGAFADAWVIGLFGASIDRLVALAVLMPVVAAACIAAGTQTQSLVMRSLALEQVGPFKVGRLLREDGPST